MKNAGQPIRDSLPWYFWCTKDPRWLNNVFLFSTEIWAEQLKKAPCTHKAEPHPVKNSAIFQSVLGSQYWGNVDYFLLLISKTFSSRGEISSPHYPDYYPAKKVMMEFFKFFPYFIKNWISLICPWKKTEFKSRTKLMDLFRDKKQRME